MNNSFLCYSSHEYWSIQLIHTHSIQPHKLFTITHRIMNKCLSSLLCTRCDPSLHARCDPSPSVLGVIPPRTHTAPMIGQAVTLYSYHPMVVQQQPSHLSEAAAPSLALLGSGLKAKVSLEQLAILTELTKVSLPDVQLRWHIDLDIGTYKDEGCEVCRVHIRVGEAPAERENLLHITLVRQVACGLPEHKVVQGELANSLRLAHRKAYSGLSLVLGCHAAAVDFEPR